MSHCMYLAQFKVSMNIDYYYEIALTAFLNLGYFEIFLMGSIRLL